MFNNLFYGICDSNNENNIIFCGGERHATNTIIYDIDKNILVKSKGKDLLTKLNDKTFYKISPNYCANIPDSKVSNEKSIVILDLTTNDATNVIFNDEGKADFQFEEFDGTDVSVKPIIENNDLIKISKNEIIMNNNNELLNDDKIVVNEEKINLEELKNGEIKDNEQNEDIRNKNEKEIKNTEINVEKETKENDNAELLDKFKLAKNEASGSLINEQNKKLSPSQEKDGEKKGENDEEDKKEEINENVNIYEKGNINNEKNENLNNFEKRNQLDKEVEKKNEVIDKDKKEIERNNIFKTEKEKKLKKPIINLKQAQIFNGDKHSKASKSTNGTRILARSVYLNSDDDHYNNEYDNYRFYEMTPNYKSKNKLNLSTNVEIKIKNPLSNNKKKINFKKQN